jgi:hypothetical protein
MTRKTFLTYTVIVALCGLSLSAAFGWRYHQQPVEPYVAASWKQHFKDAKELVKGSDAVVLARADSVAPGRVAYSSDGEDSLAFEVVNFTVVDGMKGEKNGSTVSVERVSSTTPDGNMAYFNFDGGNFEVGGTYLLFLKKQEDGGPFYYQINDQGRFHEEGGQLRAVEPDDPVAALFHGRTVKEGKALVKENK